MPASAPEPIAGAHGRASVAIVQRRLTHYRVPLFERMKQDLAARGIGLRLLVGRATPAELHKRDEGQLAWAEPLPTRYLLGEKLCWIDFGAATRDADLVVVPQENKLVYNLLALSLRRPRRIAYWGHGRNMQSRAPGGLRERFKRQTLRSVDWWFAYTRMTLPVLQAAGFDAGRTTVLDNAIDTRSLIAQWQQAARDRSAQRREFGLGEGPVGIFVGSLYPDKRIPFLLAAARRIRQQLPTFELLLVGDGPSRDEVQAFCANEGWVHWAGMLTGGRKAQALAAADVMLNPGLVGLGILDSFACEVPMVTTDCGIHSPEICYLENGVNGLMTPDDLEAFVAASVRALQNPALLRQGARASAAKYTIEHMSGNFCAGIERCLALPGGGR